MSKANLYDEDVYSKCLSRLNALSESSTPAWGKMDAPQMLAHCAEIIEVSNGKDLKNTPFLVKMLKKLIRKMVLSDQPYHRNGKTHPQYIMESEYNFDSEKKRLLDGLAHFIQEKGVERAHPLLGVLSSDEKGQAMYKHLHHHLEQFGV